MNDLNLAEKSGIDGFEVNLNKTKIKVPKLKIAAKKQRVRTKKVSSQIPISTLINILIKASVENARQEAKEKPKEQTEKTYKIIKDDKDENTVGYGAASRTYAEPIHSSYIDYGKLFGYLGNFKARNAYDNVDSLSNLNKNPEISSFNLISSEAIEKGARFVRYAKHPTIDLNMSSLVPITGMDSQEWEKFKLWKQLDPVMYLLKTTTS